MNNSNKKVLLVSRNLMAGGIESSSINFIENMQDSVNIEAFFCNFAGVLKNKIPQNIKIHNSNKLLMFFSGADNNQYKTTTKPSKFKTYLRNIIKFFYIRFGFKNFLKYLAIRKVKIKEEYDCALCFFAQNDLCSRVVVEKVKAKQKIAYIHTDAKRSPISKQSYKLLFKYDKILCVSKSCANIFKEVYPKLAEKTDFLYNFQDNNKIKQQAIEFDVCYPKTFNIVTVARLSDEEKAFFRSLKIFKRLKNEGFDFCWHIVGDGMDREKIKNYILANNMSDYIILHGNQSNPYPYIKAADLFFLGSNYESWGMVIVESLILGIPVVTTNTCSAYEILEDKCFICENNEDSIYEHLKLILTNNTLLNNEKNKISNYLFDNENTKLKFINILKDKENYSGK